MDSSSHRLEEEKRKNADLRRQIALLQAQLPEDPETTPVVSDSKSPKRKKPEPRLLAPATPSPSRLITLTLQAISMWLVEKKRKLDHDSSSSNSSKALFPSLSRHGASKHGSLVQHKPNTRTALPLIQPAAPSNVLSNLAALNGRPVDTSAEMVARSSAFTERPQTPPVDDHADILLAPKRDARLALIEDLEPGPYDHTPPHDDVEFQRLEPNSGIRLSCVFLQFLHLCFLTLC